MVFNPFATEEVPVEKPKGSAWDRLPESYRNLCKALAGKRLSPKNRRVREEADRVWARRTK